VAARRPLDQWRRANLCQRKQTNVGRRRRSASSRNRASSERELGMAGADLKALLPPKWHIEFDQHWSKIPNP